MIVIKAFQWCDDHLVSATTRGKYRLHYWQDVETTPLVGKVYAFRDRESAEDGCARLTDDYMELHECETREAEEAKVLADIRFMSTGERTKFIARFWDGKLRDIDMMMPPAGTVVCPSVTPKRKVGASYFGKVTWL